MSSSIQCESSLSLVKQLADRFRNLDRIKEIVLHPDNTHPNELFPLEKWHDLSLADGYPGILLLLFELERAYPDERWEEASHQCVISIKNALETQGYLNPSLFAGLAGVCYSIHQASKEGTRYKKLISALNQLLLDSIENEYLILLQHQLENKEPANPMYYETVQGLAGIGSYILKNLHITPFWEVGCKIATLLSGLSAEIKVEGKTVQGWYVSPSHFITERDQQAYPKGYFNLGLSHGIPGVLSFLSIASLNGLEVKGQREAMEKMSVWLKIKRIEREGNFFWKDRIAFQEEVSDEQMSSMGTMDAWCYGTPGVAISLHLAGQALKRKDYQQFALESFESIFKRTEKQWNIAGPTFCHGICGMLTLTATMARATQSPLLMKQIPLLEKRLLEFYRPEYPLGFKDYVPSKEGTHIPVDNAGLLTGVAGILLSLLSIHFKASPWQFPFLIDSGLDQ